MGKRVEKAFSREKGQPSHEDGAAGGLISGSHHSDRKHSSARKPASSSPVDGFRIVGQAKRVATTIKKRVSTDDEPKPFVATGNFAIDYADLCQRTGKTPMAVVPRAHRPTTPPPQPVAEEKAKGRRGGGATTAAAADDKKTAAQPAAAGTDSELEPELTESGEPIELPPKTYVTKEMTEYFKPSIQIETEHHDKHDYTTEIYVRGWLIDTQTMQIFNQCCHKVERLHMINLWHTGLTIESLQILADLVPRCATLKSLILDNNPIKEPIYHIFIRDKSPLQHLSLRYNQLDDKAAELLSYALGTTLHQNSTLLSLNLNGNRLTDDGLIHLSKALRTNRTLLCLSLANNKIGNRGVEALAQVLSQFPLTHDEIVERRKLIYDRGLHEQHKASPVSRRGESRERPSSVRSVNVASKSGKASKGGKKDAKKDDDKHEKGGKGKKDAEKTEKIAKKSSGGASQDTSSVKGGKKGEKPTKGKQKSSLLHPEVEQNVDTMSHPNALLDTIKELGNGVILLAGNRSLVSVNLAYNQISEEGVKSLLSAVEYQISTTAPGPGLLRVVLLKNRVSADNEDLVKLRTLLLPKDPYYQASAASPDPESVKV